ncbi:MAG: GNAT family N-acetyltransferase [Candidatus Krumholzibacteria bacterium]|nr:GNAT family N-acetyltransferase [Candidatus Krumholzibacteria bacterium]
MFSATNCEKGTHFVFREAKTIDDLGALLRLRYRVYRNSNLAKFIPQNDFSLDVDCYDVRARHFGLFEVKKNKERAVGYLRVVEDRPVPAQHTIFSLVNGIPELRRRLEETPEYPFPMMNYLPDPSVLENLRESIAEDGERMIEPCRFALDESFRSLRLARHMVESILAIFGSYLGIDHAIYCCDAANAAFYKAYGFNYLEGIPVSDFAGIGEKSCCLFASYAELPLPVRERIELMADAYAETGRICCVPGEPNQFYSSEPAPDYDLIFALATA